MRACVIKVFSRDSSSLSSSRRNAARLPLTTRLEQAFADRVSDLPAVTRTALLVAALNDSSLLSEVLAAAGILAGAVLTVDALTPAVSARLVEIGETEFRFRHPLMRTTIHQDASVSQRHAAHAALADALVASPSAAYGTGRHRSSGRTRGWPASWRRPQCARSGTGRP